MLVSKGLIAGQEGALMLHALLLMLIVAVPVYILIFFFAWWYRAGNKKAVYMPNWEHAKMDELIWWAIPLEIILILGALTWTSTHALDPKKPLVSDQPPLVVEVVALDWKWLFIYPEEGIATVNYLRVPVGRPLQFEVTADAPMNSFWIPQLGGQIYAMTGMVNTLNLEADEAGTYRGGSANYSGAGFADMQFSAQAVPADDFATWVAGLKASAPPLTPAEYAALTASSSASSVMTFGGVAQNLYNNIVDEFMQGGDSSMPGMHM